jgi:hypothetical protein
MTRVRVEGFTISLVECPLFQSTSARIGSVVVLAPEILAALGLDRLCSKIAIFEV